MTTLNEILHNAGFAPFHGTAKEVNGQLQMKLDNDIKTDCD